MVTIAIAGRPNVGKSTLFNRLVGKSMAIVDDVSGVTRDWREDDASLYDFSFRLLDTAGLEDRRDKGSLAARTAARTHEALAQTDVILMIVDGKVGILPDDKVVAREIRKTGKPVILLVNKCDGSKLPAGFEEAETLGFPDPIPLSAVHGDGLMDLYDALRPYRPDDTEEEIIVETPEGDDEEPKHLNLAIVGRPNAGKSTLINRLLGKDRVLTGPEPGLTRDSIPIKWTYGGKPVRLIDTAGLRRRSRVEDKLEKLSAKETLRTIRLAHVVILVLDATAPFDKQDFIIAQHVVEEGRALILAINKWDLVEDKKTLMKMIKDKITASLAQVAGVPILPISALKGTGIESMMKESMHVYEVWNTRISTGRLNRWLEGMVADHSPPIISGKRVKLRYMTQLKSRPPTFVMWVNKPVDLPDSYTRFLTNGLRRVFGLESVPIRWLLRKGSNPYEGKREEKSGNGLVQARKARRRPTWSKKKPKD